VIEQQDDVVVVESAVAVAVLESAVAVRIGWCPAGTARPATDRRWAGNHHAGTALGFDSGSVVVVQRLHVDRDIRRSGPDTLEFDARQRYVHCAGLDLVVEIGKFERNRRSVVADRRAGGEFDRVVVRCTRDFGDVGVLEADGDATAGEAVRNRRERQIDGSRLP